MISYRAFSSCYISTKRDKITIHRQTSGSLFFILAIFLSKNSSFFHEITAWASPMEYRQNVWRVFTIRMWCKMYMRAYVRVKIKTKTKTDEEKKWKWKCVGNNKGSRINAIHIFIFVPNAKSVGILSFSARIYWFFRVCMYCVCASRFSRLFIVFVVVELLFPHRVIIMLALVVYRVSARSWCCCFVQLTPFVFHRLWHSCRCFHLPNCHIDVWISEQAFFAIKTVTKTF